MAKDRRNGVRSCAQARCECGWYGTHWYGAGQWANAAGEYDMHKEKCKAWLAKATTKNVGRKTDG